MSLTVSPYQHRVSHSDWLQAYCPV